MVAGLIVVGICILWSPGGARNVPFGGDKYSGIFPVTNAYNMRRVRQDGSGDCKPGDSHRKRIDTQRTGNSIQPNHLQDVRYDDSLCFM